MLKARRDIIGRVGATGWKARSRSYGKINQENMSTTELPTKTEAYSSGLVIAADLGGTNLRAATISSGGQIHERVKHQTPKTERAEEIVRALVAAARECEHLSGERGKQINALSVVVPGTVQIENGVVTKAPNLP